MCCYASASGMRIFSLFTQTLSLSVKEDQQPCHNNSQQNIKLCLLVFLLLPQHNVRGLTGGVQTCTERFIYLFFCFDRPVKKFCETERERSENSKRRDYANVKVQI
uniref:Secreted protein n=1 Tax=Nothobranchius furzeri TaxID=105023 RepID=A0A1A8UAK2_NOTFU